MLKLFKISKNENIMDFNLIDLEDECFAQNTKILNDALYFCLLKHRRAIG